MGDKSRPSFHPQNHKGDFLGEREEGLEAMGKHSSGASWGAFCIPALLSVGQKLLLSFPK